MSSIIVEIRAGEGGDDAKDLVEVQYNIYKKFAVRKNFSIEVLDARLGMIIFKAVGKNIEEHFQKECGGFRWQRIPPTERKGRVHTSTITVVTLPEPKEIEFSLNYNDLEIKTTRGSGPGGQHRNKTDSAVQIKHLPSGLMVRSENHKSQYQNKDAALSILRARLYDIEVNKETTFVANSRKQQAGSGMRGDKTRTIRLQDDIVVDHISDRKISAKEYMKGFIDLLK